jgi:hypothetical protein
VIYKGCLSDTLSDGVAVAGRQSCLFLMGLAAVEYEFDIVGREAEDDLCAQTHEQP